MNELTRKDQILLITEMIADIWGRYPDLRLGQLIASTAMKYVPHATLDDLYMSNDIDLIDALTDYDEFLQQERTDELADHTG